MMSTDGREIRSDTTVTRRFVVFSQVVGWLVLVLSLATLATWLSGKGPLRGLVQADTGMRAGTAVVGLLAAAALLLGNTAPRSSRALSVSVVLLCGLALLAYTTDAAYLDWHRLESWLPLWPQRPPGRMAELSALALFFLGIAGAAVVSRRAVWLREACLLIAIAIAITSMASYGLALAESPTELLSRVPVMSALVSLSLALGWMASVPTTGLTRISVANSFGGTFARRMVLPSLLLPIVLTFLFKSVQSWLGISEALAAALAAVASGGLVTVMVLWVAFLLDRSERQRRRLHSLREDASTDALTGLANRRMFDNTLARALQSNVRVALLMLDLDHFKSFNDSFGHQAGDEALRSTGRLLREAIRGEDLAARYGGEEFAIVLPQVDAQHTALVAQRILDAFRNHAWPLRPVTISIGATLSTPDDDPQSLVRRADAALYRSKQEGRDRVTFSDR